MIKPLNAINYYTWEEEHPRNHIKSGISFFDHRFINGLTEGQFMCFYGTTNMGKTRLLISILGSAARLNPNENFLYITSEDTIKDIQFLLCSNYSNINADRIRNHQLTKYERPVFDNSLTALSNVNVARYSTNDELEQLLNSAHDQGIRYIFFDYIGSVASSDSKQEWQELRDLGEKLRYYSMDKGMCILAAAQASTALDDKKNISFVDLDRRYLACSRYIANKLTVGIGIISTAKGQFTGYLYKNTYGEKGLIWQFSMNLATSRILNETIKEAY